MTRRFRSPTRRVRRYLALAVVAALLGTGCSTLGVGASEARTFQAEFDRTFNLFSGSRVRVLGVDVGMITALDVPEGADTVTVTIELSGDTKLPADVAATIVPEALLGERYIQLAPAYTGGPELEPGETITRDRTTIPTEWDEVFHTVNDLVTGLDEDELARLVENLAEVLDGRGDDLGRVLEQVNEAVAALEGADDEIVDLARQLANLNETLNTRDEELGDIIDDWDTVVTAIAEQRGDLDSALGGLATFTRELADLLSIHNDNLQADVATLTRVGRTAVRNLDEIERSIHGQANLFEFAFKAFDFDHNWMPLVNHATDVPDLVRDRVNQRLVGLCLRLDVPECSTLDFWEQFTGAVPLCLPPVAPCPAAGADRDGPGPEDDETEAVGDVIDRALDAVPGLRERLAAERGGAS